MFGAADVLDNVAVAAEIIDPTTYITSGGDKYLTREQAEAKGLIGNKKLDKSNSDQANKDRGSSAGRGAGIYDGYVVCDGKSVICK